MNAGNEAKVVATGVCKLFEGPDGEPFDAVDQISMRVLPGELTALVGPDGAGKTTLLRMMAGLMKPDAGQLMVLGTDVARDPQSVQNRISYMPQRFGLYEDLSVQENLDLYADLHGVPQAVRAERFGRMLEMVDMARFTARPAGKLSGGMKQKLGLACTLVRSPDLLLLDEPSVGVDPLSRRDLWRIVMQLVEAEGLSVIVSTAYMDEASRCSQVFVMHRGKVLAEGSPAALRQRAEGLTGVAFPSRGVLARDLQASLIDARDLVIDAVPRGGAVNFIRQPGVEDSALIPLCQGARIEGRKADLEDAFMMLLRQHEDAADGEVTGNSGAASVSVSTGTASAADRRAGAEQGSAGHAGASRVQEVPQGGRNQTNASLAAPTDSPAKNAVSRPERNGKPAIMVHDLVRKFGDFTAVASTSFEVARGEIFGLLGPNGAGKTTTFRMLCGLLPATSGQLEVAGVNLRFARAQARARIGYVAQKFSLYGNLTVRENLTFFGGAYGLHGRALNARVEAAIEEFELNGKAISGAMPAGFKQRLAMAAGLLHQPEILFLDEPTSGIDPLARRAFWRTITRLAQQGVTIVITTHFMEEAEYCDRIAIQDAGRMLALGTPAQVREQAGAAADADMNDAFIGIVEQGRASTENAATTEKNALQASGSRS